jgi:uncharacterized tellurite resistance protein B-like protein
MIDLITRFFGGPQEDSGTNRHQGQVRDIRVATCALFLEIANIDGEFSEVERQHILTMLQEEYELSEEYAEELKAISKKELKRSIDLWKFTNLINDNYTDEEKIRVVELLWRLVYADGHMSEHENYLAHKVGKLLRLKHRDIIEAKVRVLEDRRS